MTWAQKLTSRKFLMAVATLLSVVLLEWFDVDVAPETLATAGGVIATWIFTEGQVDKANVNQQLQTYASAVNLLQRRVEQQASALVEQNQ